MKYGGGTITLTQNQTPPTVIPPFPGNSADNGLSVDTITGRIVFGDFDFDPIAPGRFLNNRALFFENNALFGYDTVAIGNQILVIDPVNGLFQLGEITPVVNNLALSIDNASNIIRLGDIGNVANLMTIDNNSNEITLTNAGSRSARIIQDVINGIQLQLGDIDITGDQTLLVIADSGAFGTGGRLRFTSGAREYFIVDVANQVYRFGDVTSAIGNGGCIIIDDTIPRIFTQGFNELIGTSGIAFANNAAAAAGTLLNAPAAGNPTKWIPINDNGTIRNIPAW